MITRIGKMDIGLFAASLLLLGMGIVLVYSSSFAVAQDKFGGADFFLSRHVIRAVIALVCFMVFINVDYHLWGKLAGIAFGVSLALLAIVLFIPAHHAVNGAKRWLTLGPVSFQASEFALLAMVIILSQRCEDLGPEIREWKRLAQNLLKIGIVAGLVILEPNFSTAFVVALVGLTILFLAGTRWWHVSAIVLGGLPVVAAGLLAAPYRRARLMHFLHGSGQSTNGVGYQAHQALIGLGNGGLFGVGLGQGKEKLFYLPEPHTDFVFSIIGEEAGFIGLVVVMAIFGFIVYRGCKVALNAPDKTGQLMAFGFSFLMALYVIIHACVNVGLMPTTGVPLPFLSYGGMSLIFTMASIGIILNISSQNTQLSAEAVRQRRDRAAKFSPAAMETR